jgi:aerobic C4-dicarboxylate transport protein
VKSSPSRFYLWVLIAIIIGGLIGHFTPATGVALKPLGDGFISLIKMLIAPVIFLTVVLGIAGVSDVKKVGRVGVKAILYFEVVSTFALVIGLVVVNVLKPGAGFNVDPATLDAAAVEKYAAQAHDQSTVGFLLHIIPKTFTDAFTGSGDLLQVLLLALLFGFAMMSLGETAQPIMKLLDALSKTFFKMMGMVMRLAPIGAGGAMAFTIGKYGVDSLGPMLKLMGSFYLTCLLFVLIVLGTIARLTGFNILRFIRYIREELLLVLGTSSSESALVPMMQKLEKLGCSKSVVGLVIPSGYSFNLDGTNIYLTMASIFVAQALNIELTLT